MALSMLVTACSIIATAWLTVHSTAVAIRQEQGQVLDGEHKIYDTLLGYAATHHDWRGAGPLVKRLAEQNGQRITLTDTSRRPLVDSAPAAEAKEQPLPAEASTTVDPLAVDKVPGTGRTAKAAADVPCTSAESAEPGLGCRTANGSPPAPATGSIDPRAVGPFLLKRDERRIQNIRVAKAANCLREEGWNVGITERPTGRSVIEIPAPEIPLPDMCGVKMVDLPLPTEADALKQLDKLVAACLTRQGAPAVSMNLDMSWSQKTKKVGPANYQTVSSCVDTGRKEQLLPYVTVPALLFLGRPAQTTSTFLDLSPTNRARIAGVTALVLLVTTLFTAVAGLRMVRPLRALVTATRRMTAGDLSTRVRIGANDEIGSVATAFNAMSEQRERSEKLRRSMVSDVAHELRTPLSNIRGWLEAAEHGIAVPDQALLSALVGEAVVLQHIIDDLRDLSAADAGELRLMRERVDIADLLDQVATAHQGNAKEAGLRLETRCVDYPEAVADPVRLRQAIGNLVSNAVRYSRPGGHVTLSARTEDGQVVVEVADTGDGIAPEDVPRLFDRFWRAEGSRSRQTGGSGLGLSIVRKLAEAHGGTATARSTLGVGSVFTLRIPVEP
ncbi:HAMP domain-containing histidine kinase [Streptomyces sp. NBC_00878]|nr:HAMP domain-containing histidine kinase [Streptomyces sp. NBC_00878]